MKQTIIHRQPYGSSEQVFFPCGHYRFWGRGNRDRTDWDCAFCDTPVLYHGTSVEALLSIIEDGHMWEQTPADSDITTALDYAQTSGNGVSRPCVVVLVLDIEKARMKPAITGYYESESTVPLEAIVGVKVYRTVPKEAVVPTKVYADTPDHRPSRLEFITEGTPGAVMGLIERVYEEDEVTN